MKRDKIKLLKGILILTTTILWVLVAVCVVIIAIVTGLLPDSLLLTLIGIETLAALALIACCCMIEYIERSGRREK